MKGVVLAGGSGTRLQPMTRVMNKHILPIYDEPLIYYPVRTLISAGIQDIMIISNAEHIGKYIQLLEEENFTADFRYRVQSEPKGIADAVSLAEDFVDDKFTVILGDNVIIGDLSEKISEVRNQKAKIFLKQVDKPTAYGVAEINNGKVMSIQEKPNSPKSDLAVIGLYVYDKSVFDIIKEIEPSDRGEYEITDVNEKYIKQGNLTYERIENKWYDAGTPDGILRASKEVRKRRQ